jgi:hypothetical protein
MTLYSLQSVSSHCEACFYVFFAYFFPPQSKHDRLQAGSAQRRYMTISMSCLGLIFSTVAHPRTTRQHNSLSVSGQRRARIRLKRVHPFGYI